MASKGDTGGGSTPPVSGTKFLNPSFLLGRSFNKSVKGTPVSAQDGFVQVHYSNHRRSSSFLDVYVHSRVAPGVTRTPSREEYAVSSSGEYGDAGEDGEYAASPYIDRRASRASGFTEIRATDVDEVALGAEDNTFPVMAGRTPRLELVTDDHYHPNSDLQQLVSGRRSLTDNTEDPFFGTDLPPLQQSNEFDTLPRGMSGGGGLYLSSASRLEPFHCHKPREPSTNTARNQLIAVSCLCALFLVAELVGGYLSNSLALITDATHMASDLSSFLISLFAIWVAKKKATSKMSLGYYRAEVLGALVSVLIIWVMTVLLVYLAVKRVINQDYDIEADEMLITAGLGVAFNIVMGMVLNSGMFSCNIESRFGHNHSHGGHGHSHGGHGHSHGGHGHSHGHGHDDHEHSQGVDDNVNRQLSDSDEYYRSRFESNTSFHMAHPAANTDTTHSSNSPPDVRIRKKEPTNINVRAAFIHVIGDFIQSVGVLIAAYIIKYKPEYKIVDPICTFLFSILVLFTTVTVLRDTLNILMEGVPRDITYTKVKADLQTIPGVCTVHSLLIWALTLENNVLAVHLAVTPAANRDAILRSARKILREKHKITTSTIQVEVFDNEAMSTCEECRQP